MADFTSANFIVGELLADATQQALAKRRILLGNNAVIRNPTLPTSARGGAAIKIPYIGALPDAQFLAEGIAGTPASASPDSETATVVRAYNGLTMTKWAEYQAAYAKPYEAYASQLAETIARAQEQKLVDAATASLPAMTYTVPASGTISFAAVQAAKAKWGDEQDPIALMLMHSKVWFDLANMTDSTGRPLTFEGVDKDGNAIKQFAGCPVECSDFMPVSSGNYTTVLLKAGSLLLWEQAQPRVATVDDIHKDRTEAAINAYFVAARYKCLPARSLGGVALIVSK